MLAIGYWKGLSFEGVREFWLGIFNWAVGKNMGEVVVSCEEAMDVVVVEKERESEEKRGNNECSSSMVRWDRLLPSTAIRVLLVEADDSTRQIIGALLRKCNYKGLFVIWFCLYSYITSSRNYWVLIKFRFLLSKLGNESGVQIGSPEFCIDYDFDELL